MDLVREFTFNALLKPPLPIGPGPIGTRMYYEVTGGEMVGDRFRPTPVPTPRCMRALKPTT